MPFRTLLVVILFAAPSVAAPVPDPKLTKEQAAEWDKLWSAATGNGNGAAERRLVCRLLADPRFGTEYLKGKLRPLTMSERAAKDLLARLGSEKEDEWKEAYRELRVRDVRLAMTLQEAWAETTTAEQRRRLAVAVSYWGSGAGPEYDRIRTSGDYVIVPPGRPGAGWELCHLDEGRRSVSRVSNDLVGWQTENPHAFDGVRVTLAVRTLEAIRSPEARAVVEKVAAGHPDVSVTKEAVAAVKRMKARPPAPPESRMATGLRLLHFWQQPTGTAVDPAALAIILAHPDQAVPFLKANLRPVKMTPEEAAALLRRLFGDDPAEVRAAFREFQRTDIRVALTHQEAWGLAATPDHRGRLVRAIDAWEDDLRGDFPVDDPDHKFLDFEFRKQPDNFKVRGWCAIAVQRPGVAEKHRLVGTGHMLGNTLRDLPRGSSGWRWDREESALYILDAVGTDEAVAILKEMATGHPDAHTTAVAKAVLKRRGK